MAQNQGTLVGAAIRPADSADTFASAFQNEIKGGHHSVDQLAERNAIPAERREFGMTCFVLENGKEYRLCNSDNGGVDDAIENNANWIEKGSVEVSYMSINSGGNYHDTALNGNVIVLTNTNAQAIFTGFDSSKYRRITLINNGDFEAVLNNADANSLPENQIQLPTGLASIGVEGTSELIYVESIQKWQITDAFASKYRPEHRGLSESMVEVVTTDAKSETHPIIEYEAFRDAQTTTMSKSDLNTAYPEAIRGFQVVCKEIDLIYKKTDDNTDDWVSFPLTSVV